MTSNKPKPISLHDAFENHTFTEVSVSEIGGVWVENCEGGIPSGLVRLSPKDARRLRDWLTDYLGDEDDTDKTSADDGWEDADWEGDNPPLPGDEVEQTRNVSGVIHTRRGIIGNIDAEQGVLTRENVYLGLTYSGTWRVRRAPAPDPTDVLTPGTILRDVTTFDGATSDVVQVESGSEYAIGVWSDRELDYPVRGLTAFTVESTGDRWEKQHGRWTVTKKEHRND